MSKSLFLDVIITYEDREQERVQFAMVPPINVVEDIFANPHAMESFIKRDLDEDEIAELRKFSCCLVGDTDFELPSWYLKCRGKFHFDWGGILDIS
jgi:hypothetical protein